MRSASNGFSSALIFAKVQIESFYFKIGAASCDSHIMFLLCRLCNNKMIVVRKRMSWIEQKANRYKFVHLPVCFIEVGEQAIISLNRIIKGIII